MSDLNLKFDGVTFELARPVVDSEVVLPKVLVGYRGVYVVTLFQYNNPKPHPEGITKGQWFALAVDPKLAAAMHAITPAGHSLEELKKIVATILTKEKNDEQHTTPQQPRDS